MSAAVAAAGSTSSVQLTLDGKALTEKITVPAAKEGEENYDDYNKVKANVTLPAGKHILRMDVTGAWFDVDYFTFVKGKDATDPEPIEEEIPDAIQSNLRMNYPVLSDYDVFDMNGVRLGRMSAYSVDEAVTTLKNTSAIKVQGIYLLRSVKSGMVKSVRVTR
jgi:hypothetical protein